jgi:UDP-2,3-diacylglucosamine hydrolase
VSVIRVQQIRRPCRDRAGKIGLVAGWGRYPVVVAEALARQGYQTFCLGVKDHADPALAGMCTDFEWVGLAKLGQAINYFRRHGVRDVTMAGKIHKSVLFQPWAWLTHLPDLRALRRFYKHFLLARNDNKDDTLLLAVVKEFARCGMVFAPATNYAPELLVEFAQFTRRGPSTAERKDIEFGWKVAKEMGRLDVGQSICVRDRATMAVEAIEGTDLCIERAGQLCRGASFTVVKVAKPNQDMRFDVPTIGPRTFETMAAAGARCLAIESGKTILLDQASAVRFADQHGIAIVSLTAEGGMPANTTAAETNNPTIGA